MNNFLISKHREATTDRVMTGLVPVVSPDSTIGDIEKLLEEKANDFETINYVYAVDGQGLLKGILSVKDVFSLPANDRVADVIQERPQPVVATVGMEQEEVALLALQNSIKAVPVVDDRGRFLGIVTSDMIMRILKTEAVEDILRFGGVDQRGSVDNVMTGSLFVSLRHRLPWLVFGLLGGFVIAGIIERFETVLSQYLILAAYIPLLVYMADAVGSQMQAFIIRDFSLNPVFRFSKYAARQASIVVLMAVFLSFTLYAVSLFLHRDPYISLVLGLALFFAILSSLVSGLLVPYFFQKLKFDPANASGPVATVIQDVTSVVVYFSVASLLL